MSHYERTKVDSSLLLAATYDADNRNLDLEFHSGAVYRFKDIPAPLARDLLSAPSKGKFFNAWIRDLFAFERLRDHAGRFTYASPSESIA